MSINVDLSGTDNLPDETALIAAAGQLDRRTERMAETLEDAQAKWQTVGAFYHAPESSLVYTAMDKPSRDGEEILLAVRSSKQALEAFAEEIRIIKAKRALLAAKVRLAQVEDVGSDAGVDAASRSGGIAGAVAKVVGGSANAADSAVTQLLLQGEADELAADLQRAEQECNRQHNALARTSVDVPPISQDALDQWAVQDAAQAFNRVQNSIGDPDVAMQQYLAILAGLSPAQMQQFLARNPQAILSAPPLGSDPRKNKDAWEKLTPGQRAAISAAVPSLVGNLEGIPYADRIAANAVALTKALASDDLADSQRAALEVIRKAVDAPRNGAPRGLISLDVGNPPLAAVAIGNLDTADNVTWNIPGMGTTGASMTDWCDASQNIYDMQIGLGETNIATVAWIGYRAPDALGVSSLDVLSTSQADVGGDRLASALNGFNVSSGDRNPYTSVAAHSYGTTTAAYGLTRTDFDVDSVAFYGSAGVDGAVVDDVTDLHVKNGSDGQPVVYSTNAVRDIVAPLGSLGSFRDNPLVPRDFQTHEFYSFGDPVRGLASTNGHSALGGSENGWNPTETAKEHGYLDAGTQSLDSISRITSGRAEQVAAHDQAVRNYLTYTSLTGNAP